MRLTPFLTTLFLVSFVSGCAWSADAQTEGATFSDVSARPPAMQRDTAEAISRDPKFARWVLYQDEACDRFGCRGEVR